VGLSPGGAKLDELLEAGALSVVTFFEFFFGLPPVSHWETCDAKFILHLVSPVLSASGLTLTTISVLPLALRHGSIKCVNLEFLKGTCDLPSAFARKTSARALKLLLIPCVSLSLWPSAPDLSKR